MPLLQLVSQYYDDAAGILRSLILSAVAPHRLTALPAPSRAPAPLRAADSDGTEPPGSARALGRSAPAHAASCDDLADGGGGEELRCVLAVVRHGDRTPKQKMKAGRRVGGSWCGARGWRRVGAPPAPLPRPPTHLPITHTLKPNT